MRQAGRRDLHRLSIDALNQLTDALLALDEIASATSREQVIALMGQQIASAVPFRDSARTHVVEWLRTCESFDNGRASLVGALRLALPENPARARVLALLDQLWPA